MSRVAGSCERTLECLVEEDAKIVGSRVDLIAVTGAAEVDALGERDSLSPPPKTFHPGFPGAMHSRVALDTAPSVTSAGSPITLGVVLGA